MSVSQTGNPADMTGLRARAVDGDQEAMLGLFAALLLITGTGILIFLVLTFISHMILRRWHERCRPARRTG